MHIAHNCLPSSTLPLARSSHYVAPQQAVAPARKEAQMVSLKTISEKLDAWRRYRDAVRELSQLSDRELDDIGIRRGDIEYVVRRTVAAKAAA
jgi:uncharacterized protein YjiS (DUF1127 family)